MNTSSHANDPLVARTSAAAREILARVRRLPVAHRAAEIDRAMASFEGGLDRKVRILAQRLAKRGMSAEAAIERAMSLGLADATVSRVHRIGKAYQRGEVLPLPHVLEGLGQLGQDAGAVAEQMFRGVLCAPELSSTLTSVAGKQGGQEASLATGIGFGVARGVASCPSAPAPVPVEPMPTDTDEGRNLYLPIALGIGVLAAVGGIVWFTQQNTGAAA